ncbi:MAG: DinB family protein [Chloroflexi bacterium]|nr:DinB family protein [Chloroflexota bacterium]
MSSPGEAGRDTAGGDPATDTAPGGGRQGLLARLAAGPSRVASATRRVAATEAGAGAPPGEWTPREVVAHLAAVEADVFQPRLDQLASERDPVWAWTEPGPLDTPDTASLGSALETFAALRSGTLARVTGLDEAGWSRTGTHATYGRLDVAGLLSVLVDHDEEHLAGLETRGG